MASGGDDDRTAAPSDDLGSLSTVMRQLAGDEGPAPLVPGTVIDGTYRVERPLGEGGMGVVYAARDVKLARDVAIKIGSSVSAAALARASREALALARLSHPNVVVVYQVGEIGGRIYLAMELVGGGTARAWAAGRRWREVVAMYAAAGDGLAAAHAAGLVHRDFKPDNVLIGADGRPRVADFGLARESAADEPAGDGPASLTTVTQTGAVLGTPAYMAPEQLAGGELDARADQFAFCASLWEALYGARPFGGKTPAEIADAISSAPPAPPAGERARGVPRHVTAALVRGLRVDPAGRWPDLRALCAELRRDPTARRLRIGVAAAGLAAIGGLSAIALTRGGAAPPPPPPPPACPDDPAWLAGLWDAPRSAALAPGFAATAVPGAADTAARVTARLDDYAARWHDARLDACRATYERHEQSSAAFDARIACLDAARGRLGAAVDLLSHAPDAALVNRAIDVVGALDDPAGCAGPDVLMGAAPAPIDPKVRARVAEIAAKLDQVDALISAGRTKPALAQATDALAAARALARAPLIARALLDVASTQQRLGDVDAAQAAYEEAARVSAADHDDRAVAKTWAGDLFLLASKKARLEDAERILPVAEAAVARLNNPAKLAVQVINARAKIAFNRGRLDEGLALTQQVVAQDEQIYGKDSVEAASADNNVGFALARASRYADALPHFERALAIYEKAYGRVHPTVADAIGNVAAAQQMTGHVDEARAREHEVIGIDEQLYGPDSPNLQGALTNLAQLEHSAHHDADARAAIERAVAILRKAQPDGLDLAGALEIEGDIEHAANDAAAAERDYREAIDIFVKSGGPDSAEIVGSLVGLGNLAVEAQRWTDAEASYRRAAAIAEAKLGPDHRDTILAEASLIGVLVGRHRWADAHAALQSLLPREEKAFGPEHPNVAVDLVNDGKALVGLGHVALARVEVARAVAIREKAYGPDDGLVGEALAELAADDRRLGHAADAAAEAARAATIASANAHAHAHAHAHH